MPHLMEEKLTSKKAKKIELCTSYLVQIEPSNFSTEKEIESSITDIEHVEKNY